MVGNMKLRRCTPNYVVLLVLGYLLCMIVTVRPTNAEHSPAKEPKDHRMTIRVRHGEQQSYLQAQQQLSLYHLQAGQTSESRSSRLLLQDTGLPTTPGQSKPACYTHACSAKLPRNSHDLPQIIHQTVANRRRVPCRATQHMQTWITQNPDFTYWLHEDADCRKLVQLNFPYLLHYYDSLLTPVERSDIWRYLVLHVHGGVYADIDVSCQRPVNAWDASFAKPPFSSNPQPPRLWVGMESYYDSYDRAAETKHYFPLQMTQWTIAAVPGHSLLGAMGTRSMQEAAKEFLLLMHHVAAVTPQPGRAGHKKKGQKQQEQQGSEVEEQQQQQGREAEQQQPGQATQQDHQQQQQRRLTHKQQQEQQQLDKQQERQHQLDQGEQQHHSTITPATGAALVSQGGASSRQAIPHHRAPAQARSASTQQQQGGQQEGKEQPGKGQEEHFYLGPSFVQVGNSVSFDYQATILNRTGPFLWTEAVLDYLQATYASIQADQHSSSSSSSSSTSRGIHAALAVQEGASPQVVDTEAPASDNAGAEQDEGSSVPIGREQQLHQGELAGHRGHLQQRHLLLGGNVAAAAGSAAGAGGQPLGSAAGLVSVVSRSDSRAGGSNPAESGPTAAAAAAAKMGGPAAEAEEDEVDAAVVVLDVALLRGGAWIGDVKLLPIAAFAAGQSDSPEAPKEDSGVLVLHHFMGSWKKHLEKGWVQPAPVSMDQEHDDYEEEWDEDEKGSSSEAVGGTEVKQLGLIESSAAANGATAPGGASGDAAASASERRASGEASGTPGSAPAAAAVVDAGAVSSQSRAAVSPSQGVPGGSVKSRRMGGGFRNLQQHEASGQLRGRELQQQLHWPHAHATRVTSDMSHSGGTAAAAAAAPAGSQGQHAGPGSNGQPHYQPWQHGGTGGLGPGFAGWGGSGLGGAAPWQLLQPRPGGFSQGFGGGIGFGANPNMLGPNMQLLPLYVTQMGGGVLPGAMPQIPPLFPGGSMSQPGLPFMGLGVPGVSMLQRLATLGGGRRAKRTCIWGVEWGDWLD